MSASRIEGEHFSFGLLLFVRENLGLSIGKNKGQLVREPFPVMQDFGSIFFLFFPMIGEFYRAPEGDVTGLAFAEYSIEHSGRAEQSDMATMERCKGAAFDIIQL